MLGRGPEAISPTAHYTGAVWARNGLSDPAFETLEGRVLHDGLWPLMTTVRLVGGPTLEDFLLARHQIIDGLLEDAVVDGRVGQVVEIAAGMSPRGWRFSREHPGLVYVEGDLPAMAARKRRAVERAGGTHRVVELDAFDPASLADLAATLDASQGVAVVTEGLLNYFDRDHVTGLWRRLTKAFAGFSELLYLSDLHVRSALGGPLTAGFTALLQAFVRRRVHVHFDDEADALAALYDAGFSDAELLEPAAFGFDRPGAALVRVIEATRVA